MFRRLGLGNLTGLDLPTKSQKETAASSSKDICLVKKGKPTITQELSIFWANTFLNQKFWLCKIHVKMILDLTGVKTEYLWKRKQIPFWKRKMIPKTQSYCNNCISNKEMTELEHLFLKKSK